MLPDLNELAKRVHLLNKKWWTNLETGEPIDRDPGELYMLVVSEFAEALEGHRKGLMDDHLPHRKMFEVELADALIRLLDIAGGRHLNLDVSDYVPCSQAIPTNVGTALLTLVKGTECAAEAVGWGDEHEWVTDIILALVDYAAYHKMDIWSAFEEKLAYNQIRIDHTNEARLSEGGKRY